MTTNTRKFRMLMFCLTLTFLAGMSPVALAGTDPAEQVGLLTVTGTVKINGKPAATGDIVAPGSEVQTEKGSSAVVSLGKLGRVEALPSTSMKLRYDVNHTTHSFASIAILLEDGSVKVTSGEGMVNIEAGLTATRAHFGTQEKVFTVDRTCDTTSVSVTKGEVELRFGHTVKQIAAGRQGKAGESKPGCTQSAKR
jgi:hypothetical protein